MVAWNWIERDWRVTANQFSSVQLLSCSWLFGTPWTAPGQASLSITNSGSVLKLMSIKSVMPSNHFIHCYPLLLLSIFPSIRSFPTSHFCVSGGPSIGASASVLPINIQDWFLLELTGHYHLTKSQKCLWDGSGLGEQMVCRLCMEGRAEF